MPEYTAALPPAEREAPLGRTYFCRVFEEVEGRAVTTRRLIGSEGWLRYWWRGGGSGLVLICIHGCWKGVSAAIHYDAGRAGEGVDMTAYCGCTTGCNGRAGCYETVVCSS